MARMLELGNRVNIYIDDFNYLIDGTALLHADPVVKKLLAASEPEFGRPRRDCRVDDKFYSSNFVHQALFAGRVIAAIEERGIIKPRILEIGGGLGRMAYLLKAYFRDRATYYVVDLPEGLMIQEWYLRNCLPDDSSAYKASKTRCAFLDGGFNFINAYVLESQDFHFDVAINIDSMQEMNTTAITAYLKFIERNISEKGVFYFQNHYGHASSSVAEPSEYPLDGHWNVHLAEISPQIECCMGAEQMRVIYYRTTEVEDVHTRRLVLRTLWNGFVSGKLHNDSALIAELSALPEMQHPKEAVDSIVTALAKRGIPISREDVTALQDSLYLPGISYVDVLSTSPAPKLDVHTERMDTLWCAQSNYLKALKACDEGTEFKVWLRSAADTLTMAGNVSDSEFYSAYYASILFVIGEAKAAETLLMVCASQKTSPIWLARFAELFARFGKAEAVLQIVDMLKGRRGLDWFTALKVAELSHDTTLLNKLDPTSSSDDARLLSFAKTAARLGENDTALSACTQLVQRQPESAPSIIRGVLLAANPMSGLGACVGGLLGNLEMGGSSEEFPTTLGFLLLELGRKDEALDRIESQVERFWKDYFRLGQLGRFFLQADLNELADKCFNRSIELRPGAFLHFDFVGNAYFDAGHFDHATEAYSEAVRLMPYLRNLLAKKLYSVLPTETRSSGTFGKPEDLQLVFQSGQDFYHYLGPVLGR